jgi:hypothetical protein
LPKFDVCIDRAAICEFLLAAALRLQGNAPCRPLVRCPICCNRWLGWHVMGYRRHIADVKDPRWSISAP